MYSKIKNGEIVESDVNIKKRYAKVMSFGRTLPDKVVTPDNEVWMKQVKSKASPPDGQRVASTFVKMVEGVPTISYRYEVIPRDEVEQKLKDHLSNYRYITENAGVELQPGMVVQTNRESRADLIGARIKAKEDVDYVIQWKMDNGRFITLTSSVIIMAADAAEQHVQDCFSAERFVLDNLDSYTTAQQIEKAFNDAYNQ